MTFQSNFTHAGRRLIQFAAFLVTSACALASSNVTVSWNPTSQASLAGYALYYGTTSQTYPNRIAVSPSVTSNIVANLQSGQTYYFAVTATNLARQESAYSTEVSITIPTSNTAPIANAQSVTTLEDTATAITLTGSDADGNTLAYAVLTQPTKGILTGTAPNLTYTPNLNANGADSFTFRVNDGTINSATATVSITITPVNDAPIAHAQSVTTLEDTAKAITLTGFDVEGSPLTYTVLTQPTKGTLSGTAPNLTYTPNLNANGSDSFTFRVRDGSANSAAATVSITITPVNDAPVAIAQSVTTAEDTVKAITLTGSDVDGDSLTYTVLTQPTNGTLTGTAPNLSYRPATNFFGSDSFTFRVHDGTINSATATVSITITPVNDAPIANAQSVTTLEDTAKAITLTGSDVEGSPLTFTVLTQPTKGTLTGTAPNLTYTPNLNANGGDSFTFRVNDGSSNSAPATVSITITPVNDAPVANAQSVSTLQNTAKAITLTGSDVDGNPLTYTVVTQPTKGTLTGNAPNLTYTPLANTNGADSFTFRVNDGTTNSAAATVSITITAVNIAPVANAQSVTTLEDTAKAITLTGSDPEGSTLTYTIVTQPAKGTLSGTAPNLTYTPSANTNGGDSFTFRVNDGTSNSAPATVTITITPVNDAPTLNSLANLTLADNAGPQSVSLSGISSGAANESQTLSVQATSSDTGIATLGAVNYTSPGSIGSFTLTPVTGANGTATITVTVNDGGTSNNIVTRTFSVTVTSLATLPVITLTSPQANSIYTAPATLNLAASVNANGQTIQRVLFFAHTNLVGTVTNAPYQLAWICTSETGVVLVARAIYGASQNQVDSAPVSLTHNPLPGPWEPSDVGEGAVAGRATVTNNTYFIEGAGLLSGTKDSFQYVQQPLLGDGAITIRLDSVVSSSKTARMGLMVRESLTPNARYAFIGVSPDGYIRWQRRTSTGGKTSSSYFNPKTGAPKNVWLRLTRNGSTVTGFRSTNGVNWVRLSSAKITMANNVTMGLTVASGSANNLDTTVFSNPTVVP